ncbi:MAG: hypothetical protein RLZZ450_7462 [Pseudomonadota bacterium]
MAIQRSRLVDWLGNRIGYGNLEARYWFVGLEEGCGDALQELEARLQGENLEDIYDAHRRLPAAHRRLFGDRPALQSTWRPLMIALLSAEDRLHGREELRAYQRDRLGRAQSETLLAELFPLPSPSLRHWHYANVAAIPELATRTAYHDAWRARRITLLRTLIAKRQPPVIIAYGARSHEDYKRMFTTVRWTPRFDDWCETSVANIGGRKVIVALTPHPVARGNTNSDWETLGRWIRREARR